MAWADVEAKIKFWGVDGTLNDAGLRDFGTAFDSEQKGKILDGGLIGGGPILISINAPM